MSQSTDAVLNAAGRAAPGQSLAGDAAMRAANERALRRACAVQPRWTGVDTAQHLLGLSGRVLLHAGPALADPCHPPSPMLNAAVLTCLYEGWADTEEEAEALVSRGEVSLRPSAAYRASTPLVAMISPKTTLVQLDGGEHFADRRWYGFLGTGAGAQMRFGARDSKILERLAWRDHQLSRGFSQLLAGGPVDLLSAARAGLAQGDELHSRLNVATLVLHAMLASRIGEAKNPGSAHSGSGNSDPDTAQAALTLLLDTPAYFLNLWIPACALILDAANGEPGASLVTTCCANGETLAIQLSGLPGRWFTAPATPVRGPMMPGVPTGTPFPPVTGDSAVIDIFGFGGQALAQAPALAAAFAPWMPADDAQRSSALLFGEHPVLGLKVGLDAAAVAVSGRTPLLSIGMVSPSGDGLLGRGLCELPLQPFLDGVAELARIVDTARA